MANTCWWYYIAKFTEFFDTLFFILRAKMEHVSTLHVIHHGCMPFSVWMGMKFAPGNCLAMLISKIIIDHRISQVQFLAELLNIDSLAHDCRAFIIKSEKKTYTFVAVESRCVMFFSPPRNGIRSAGHHKVRCKTCFGGNERFCCLFGRILPRLFVCELRVNSWKCLIVWRNYAFSVVCILHFWWDLTRRVAGNKRERENQGGRTKEREIDRKVAYDKPHTKAGIANDLACVRKY